MENIFQMKKKLSMIFMYKATCAPEWDFCVDKNPGIMTKMAAMPKHMYMYMVKPIYKSLSRESADQFH